MPTINSIALDSNPGKYKGIIYLNPYDILNYLDRQGNQLKKCFDKKTLYRVVNTNFYFIIKKKYMLIIWWKRWINIIIWINVNI